MKQFSPNSLKTCNKNIYVYVPQSVHFTCNNSSTLNINAIQGYEWKFFIQPFLGRRKTCWSLKKDQILIQYFKTVYMHVSGLNRSFHKNL